MLTLQKLKDMEPDTIFETGFTKDGYNAVNMYGKVHNRESIKKLVSCDDEALEMYRD